MVLCSGDLYRSVISSARKAQHRLVLPREEVQYSDLCSLKTLVGQYLEKVIY